jgi:hypothetical protein
MNKKTAQIQKDVPLPSFQSLQSSLAPLMARQAELRGMIERHILHGSVMDFDPHEPIAVLMRIAKLIKDASPHHPYMRPPYRSLWLLRYYLNHEENREMFLLFQQSVEQALEKDGSKSEFLLNHALRKIFLFHFGFQPSSNEYGLEDIFVYKPHPSEYQIKYVHWMSSDECDRFDLTTDHISALNWMMASLLNHTHLLGSAQPGTLGPFPKDEK